MREMPNGNHAVAVPPHVAQRANRKVHPVVVAVAEVTAEAQAVVKAAAAQEQVVSTTAAAAAPAASNARPAARHARSRPQARPARVHVRVAPRADNKRCLSTPVDDTHVGLAQQRVEQPDGASGLRTVADAEVRRVTARQHVFERHRVVA